MSVVIDFLKISFYMKTYFIPLGIIPNGIKLINLK
jgi:hypothetical protein